MSDISHTLTVTTSIYSTMDEVWNKFTQPEGIMHWNNASDDWFCPKATNDLRDGGKFSYTMAAKDDSFSFDFRWKYTNVEKPTIIEYRIEDWRKVSVFFEDNTCGTIKVTETFEAEKANPIEMQQAGWQAILDNFKKYVEKWALHTA